MRGGIQLHRVGEKVPYRNFDPINEPAQCYPVTVSFVLHGTAIVSGSSSGCVGVWELTSSGSTQILNHRGEDLTKFEMENLTHGDPTIWKTI